MTKKYEIAGMSCGACVKNVKQALMQIPDVEEVDVQLATHTALIATKKLLEVKVLQAQLKLVGNYIIKESVVT